MRGDPTRSPTASPTLLPVPPCSCTHRHGQPRHAAPRRLPLAARHGPDFGAPPPAEPLLQRHQLVPLAQEVAVCAAGGQQAGAVGGHVWGWGEAQRRWLRCSRPCCTTPAQPCRRAHLLASCAPPCARTARPAPAATCPAPARRRRCSAAQSCRRSRAPRPAPPCAPPCNWPAGSTSCSRACRLRGGGQCMAGYRQVAVGGLAPGARWGAARQGMLLASRLQVPGGCSMGRSACGPGPHLTAAAALRAPPRPPGGCAPPAGRPALRASS